MSTRSQKIRLGVFLMLAVLLFLGAVGTLAGVKMFNPRDIYYIKFTESVSGLEVGSTVKMNGVRVGTVDEIHIGSDVESVVVTLGLKPGTPITVDTEAVMTAIGITGLQFIELDGGMKKSRRIPANTTNSFIKPGFSTLQTLTGKATSIALKMEGLLNNLLALTTEPNRIRVRSILDNADKLLVTSEGMLSENRERLQKILGSVERATKSLEKAARSLNGLVAENSSNLSDAISSSARAARTLDRTVSGLKPGATLGAITNAANSMRKRVEDPEISKLVKSLGKTSANLVTLSNSLQGVVSMRDRQLASFLSELNRATGYLKEFARAIKERPSLLLRGDTLKEKDMP